MPANATSDVPAVATAVRQVKLPLGLGIFLMPYIFAWLTLRKGHTALARGLSLGWLGLIICNFIVRASAMTPTAGPVGEPRLVTNAEMRATDLAQTGPECQRLGLRMIEVVDPVTGHSSFSCDRSGQAHNDKAPSKREPRAEERAQQRREAAAIEAASRTPEARAQNREEGRVFVAKIAERFNVDIEEVVAKAQKAVELCAQNGHAVNVAHPLVYVEGISRDERIRQATPLTDAFVLYVAQGCP